MFTTASSKNLDEAASLLWFYPKHSQMKTGMQTSFLGSFLVKRGDTVWQTSGGVFGNEFIVASDTLKNIKIVDLKKLLTNRYRKKSFWEITQDANVRRGSDVRVMNPETLKQVFFGTYDFNMSFMLNLLRFLEANPEYEGKAIYEIVHLTLQNRIEKCESSCGTTGHKKNQTEWQLVPYDASEGGRKLGELVTLAAGFTKIRQHS